MSKNYNFQLPTPLVYTGKKSNSVALRWEKEENDETKTGGLFVEIKMAKSGRGVGGLAFLLSHQCGHWYRETRRNEGTVTRFPNIYLQWQSSHRYVQKKKKKHPRKGTIKIQQLQQQQDSNICTVSSRWRAEYMTRIHWEKAVTLAPSHVM